MIYGILLAAGKSIRFGENKLNAKLRGKRVIEWSLDLLLGHKEIDKIIVVGWNDLKIPLKNKKILAVTSGGNNRFESLVSGIKQIKNLKDEDIILIHNAANPLATKKEISKVLSFTEKFGAAGVGSRIKDTLKRINDNYEIIETVPRKNIVAMQTPQALKAKILLNTLKNQHEEEITDDLFLAEKMGIRPKLIKKSPTNFKITEEEDLRIAKIILNDIPDKYLCGVGEDSHAFSNEKGLFLGGLLLAGENKLDANSDGDVILHAISNALLSAIGQGSFSKVADQLLKKGIKDSKIYLQEILNKIKEKDLRINNLSLSLECLRPKIDDLEDVLKKSLANILNISEEKIGITATSGENLTEFGKGKGIKVICMLSLVSGQNNLEDDEN